MLSPRNHTSSHVNGEEGQKERSSVGTAENTDRGKGEVSGPPKGPELLFLKIQLTLCYWAYPRW